MLRHHAGFTLIELLTTLAISALLAGVAVPAMGRLQSRMAASSAHHLVMTAFAAARLQAVSQGQPVTVCPGDAVRGCRTGGHWEGGWIVFADHDGDTQLGPGDDLLRTEDPISPRLAIQSSAGRPRAQFRPNGMSGGANLTLRICADGAVQSAVILSNSGRARAATSSERAAMPACS